MSHELSIQNGVVEAMYVGKPAWMGLGTVLPEGIVLSDVAIMEAHLNWLVRVCPAGAEFDTDVWVSSDDLFSIVREDTKKIMGYVSERYKPVQNVEAFTFLDSLVGNGELAYESAGALKDGRVVWLLARLPHVDEIAEGDTVKRYLLFTNSHDGTRSIRCLPTSVRVVCDNTLTLALKSKGEGIKIRHVGDINKKVQAARKVLEDVSMTFQRVMCIERRLAETKIVKHQFVEYVNTLFPEVGEDGRAKTIRENIVLDIATLFYRGRHQQLTSIKDTAWAAFNAVTEYVDHCGRRKVTKGTSEAEARMSTLIFGHGAAVKRQAFSMAQQKFLNMAQAGVID